MITIQERFPWYMSTVGGVGAISLVTGVGTLTAGFVPLFGSLWAWGAAVLLDTLALSLTVWAIQSIRKGIPAGMVRLAAHGCIGVSVVVQATVAAQGLSSTAGGWTSAAMHTLPPMVFGLTLELIYQHYARQWRKELAPVLAAETMREQMARASVGCPVQLKKVQRAVIRASRAGILDMRALTAHLTDDDLLSNPAIRVLHSVIDPDGARELTTRARTAQALTATSRLPLGFGPAPAATVSVETPREMTQNERRREVSKMLDENLPGREISRRLGKSSSTISGDIQALRAMSDEERARLNGSD